MRAGGIVWDQPSPEVAGAGAALATAPSFYACPCGWATKRAYMEDARDHSRHRKTCDATWSKP